jgi:tryptophanyl-tRNA synthetase
MAKPILVSGVQPTGRLHLGNYLGAIKNFVDLQNSGKYECYFFIADLHSLTGPFEGYKAVQELMADFMALGLDPKKSVIFQQSRIPAHAELSWIFESLTPMGELRRMTQYKDKSEGEKETANSGLLTYPVLMAADILLYDPVFVPVGDDQVQHIELARTIARKFNAKYGELFREPKDLLTSFPRVMSLKNPEKKMSKSDPASCLFLDDTPEEIRAKVGRATTDSGSEIKFDADAKAGVSNLLQIQSALTGTSIPSLEKEYAGRNYSDFKRETAEIIISHLADYRAKKTKLISKKSALENALKAGSAKAAKKAEKKIALVKKRVGLI